MICPTPSFPGEIRVNCANPVLRIGFPTCTAGPNTVTLANGAVIDREELGQVLSTFCPSLVCPITIPVGLFF